jgi:hypothetical protein
MGESDDVTDTEQLIIFICVIDAVFHVHEEVASLRCLNGNTIGKGLFLKKSTADLKNKQDNQ